jgi:flagellar motor switch protein FliN/FliY
MSETEDFLTEHGQEFRAVANEILTAVLDGLNTFCAGKLSFGEPSVTAASAANMPKGFTPPFAAAMCESTGDAAGPFAIIFDIASAQALAALMTGAEPPADAGKSGALEPNEMDAFNELASTACAAVGAALRKAGASASTALKPVRTAASAEDLLDSLRGENVFIAAEGKIAGLDKPILLACSTDLCRAAVKEAAPAEPPQALSRNLERILKIPVPVIAVLAEKAVPFRDVLALTEGSVIEFEKASSEPLMLLVNDRKVGIGRVVKIGERFGLRIEDIGDAEDIVHKLR